MCIGRSGRHAWTRGISAAPASPLFSQGATTVDLRDRLVPTPVSPCLLGGARIGRWHGLAEEHALAFAMGTHARLGAGGSAGAGGGGRRRSRRVLNKSPAEGQEGRGCVYLTLQGELVKMVVEACQGKGPWEVGEGVAWLTGWGRRSGWHV